MLSPCDPAIALHGVYPKEAKTSVHTKPAPPKFTAASLMIARTWERLRRPSAGKGINPPSSIHTMSYRSAPKRKGLRAMGRHGGTCYRQGKEATGERHRLCDSNYLTLWKRQKLRQAKKKKKRKSSFLGLGERTGGKGRAQRLFRTVKLVCPSLRWWFHVSAPLWGPQSAQRGVPALTETAAIAW